MKMLKLPCDGILVSPDGPTLPCSSIWTLVLDIRMLGRLEKYILPCMPIQSTRQEWSSCKSWPSGWVKEISWPKAIPLGNLLQRSVRASDSKPTICISNSQLGPAIESEMLGWTNYQVWDARMDQVIKSEILGLNQPFGFMRCYSRQFEQVIPNLRSVNQTLGLVQRSSLNCSDWIKQVIPRSTFSKSNSRLGPAIKSELLKLNQAFDFMRNSLYFASSAGYAWRSRYDFEYFTWI